MGVSRPGENESRKLHVREFGDWNGYSFALCLVQRFFFFVVLLACAV